MSEGPPGNERKSENAPDFEVKDRDLRIATWLREGKYGLLPSSKLDKTYTDADGEIGRTNQLSHNDYLRAARLWEKTNDRFIERDQEYKRTLPRRNQDWADEDRTPEQNRRDAYDKRLAEDRSQTRRRAKPRDRSAR